MGAVASMGGRFAALAHLRHGAGTDAGKLDEGGAGHKRFGTANNEKPGRNPCDTGANNDGSGGKTPHGDASP